MKTYLIPLLSGVACLFAGNSYAQLVNSGDALTLSDNSLIHVSGDFINVSGSVQLNKNATLEVKGNVLNNDINSVGFTTDSKGTVALSGDYQEIDGQRIVFPALSLSGTAAKALKTDVDVSENGILTIDNVQLDADVNTIFLKNPMPDALVRTGRSFISTTKNGALIRKTNSDQEYLFPLGSTNLNQALQGVDTLYRPVYFKPENSFDNSFAASLINEDPTMSGFDKSKKRYDVKNVSDKYFYLLGQKQGTSKFDVSFYQNTAVEDGYSQLVSWGNFLQWEKAAPSRVATGTYFDDLNSSTLNQKVQFSSIQSFNEMPFTFSSEQGGVNPFTFFNAFSPDGDNKNDTWKINNIELYPDNKLTIYNRWGDEVFSAKGYTNDKAWDGGTLQSGTYYYVLTATVENQARVFKGFITMIKKN